MSENNCRHQFIECGQVSRPGAVARVVSGTKIHAQIFGRAAVCVSCGEVRHAYEDGKVVVTAAGGSPLDRYDDKPKRS